MCESQCQVWWDMVCLLADDSLFAFPKREHQKMKNKRKLRSYLKQQELKKVEIGSHRKLQEHFLRFRAGKYGPKTIFMIAFWMAIHTIYQHFLQVDQMFSSKSNPQWDVTSSAVWYRKLIITIFDQLTLDIASMLQRWLLMLSQNINMRFLISNRIGDVYTYMSKWGKSKYYNPRNNL